MNNNGPAEYAEMTTHRAVELIKEITVYFSDISRQVHRHKNDKQFIDSNASLVMPFHPLIIYPFMTITIIIIYF